MDGNFPLALFLLVASALAVATASVTLTRARIFQPLRTWLETKNFVLYKLASCPYCLSHWLALFLAPSFHFTVTGTWGIDFAVTWLTLVGLAAFLGGGMMNILHMSESRIQELEDELFQANTALQQRQQHWAPARVQEAIDSAYQNGLINGQKQERERYAAMEVRLRAPIT